MRLTNKHNIPLSVAVFLASDSYNFKQGSKRISVTTLNNSIRQTILRNRLNLNEITSEPTDITSLVKSRNGTAIHAAIENVWMCPDKRRHALLNLGYPDSVIERIVVNGDPRHIQPHQIPIYMEVRDEIQIGDWTLSGQFDYVESGVLTDFKSTSTFTYMNQTKDDDYIRQLSLNKLIHKDIITEDYCTVVYWFTDWKQSEAERNPKYPKSPILEVKFDYLPEEECLAIVKEYTQQLDKYANTAEPDLPYCKESELWKSADVYKYYANPEKMAKATKNFDTMIDAQKYKASKQGKGIVVHKMGGVKRCTYCAASSVCTQYKRLKEAGLILE